MNDRERRGAVPARLGPSLRPSGDQPQPGRLPSDLALSGAAYDDNTARSVAMARAWRRHAQERCMPSASPASTRFLPSR